ncbi:zinc c2h2 [Diplodia corticola]|uniref:Zinc c2h2 n=1 Tax=Diplodia corticola TaxID=236234 RepID=A0A1J9R4V9_9PEZI|nr:zinc c2h2 [Diplodia corticola]OJD35601.1 zinc c2h2 [Diplodia corticola]
MFSSPASSGTVGSSAASASSQSRRRSDAQHRGPSLDAYLQDDARSYRPPIDAWQEGSAGFTERIATNYSLPQPSHNEPLLGFAASAGEVDHQYPYATSITLSKSSMAPSQAPPPPQVHNRAPSTVASASAYSSSRAGGPPSLIHDDRTSCAESSSVDTEYGKIVQGVRLLEPDADGVLVQPPPATTPVYECTFHFLACRFWTRDEADWRLHNLCHFHGNPPPRSVTCPLCDQWGFDGADGAAAWDARMSHLAAHVRMGATLATSRPDFKLFRYLWQKRIIDDAEYKELNGRGSLSPPRSGLMAGPSHTTEGPSYDERRRRIPHYPRPRGY